MDYRYYIFFSIITVIYGIEIPRRGWISEEVGVLMEPDTLIIHYDRIVYNTVGIKFNLFSKDIVGGNISSCNLKLSRKQSIDKLDNMIVDFFHTLPRHFSDFTDHYCTDGSLDCHLSYVNDTTLQKRDKRQIFAAIVAIAGLTAVGTGLYHMMSEADVNQHLRQVDQNIGRTADWIDRSSRIEDQYHKLSESLYTKLYHGVQNNEKSIINSICQLQDEQGFDMLYFHYSAMIESYKNQFLQAMDGKVTEYLVSYDFLLRTLLSRPEFEKTAYKVDPGLFYLASTGMLTRVDYIHRIAYFTITTPILQELDVSPLYRIYNVGWWEGEHWIRINIPNYSYFLTDKERVEMATPNLDRCRITNGIYLCNLRDSQMTKQSACLTDLILKQDNSACSLLLKPIQNRCRFEITKGGLFLFGCPEVSKITSFRGLPRSEEIPMNKSRSTFISYRDFKQISIEGNIISSKGTYVIHKDPLSIKRPSANLSELVHLVIPGVEQDLSALQDLRERSQSTAEGYFKDLYSKHKEGATWFWYLIGFIGIINGLCLLRAILSYLKVKIFYCACCQPKSSQLQLSELIERQRNRIL